MRILFLTDNFPPESNAPAVRTIEHAREWVKAGHQVTVVTCVPNFPRGVVFEGYRNLPLQCEQVEGIHVVRVWTYITANEGTLKRILDYASFMVSATITCLFLRRRDVVIGTSPQFFTAVAAWLVSKLKRCPFVFELRDLWPETILAVGAMKRGPVASAIQRVASFLYRQADLMVPVTNAFARHLEEEGVAPERIVVVTNGIEPGQHGPRRSREEVRAQWGIPEDAFVAGYIGTIGMCHGLSAVLDAAELTRGDRRFHYVLMGEGADKEEVETLARERDLENVTILAGQPRQGAIDLLSAIDVSLVLLRDSRLFETVIPSKLFEAMDLQKPILLGLRGESRAIVVDEVGCGLAFPPEDAQGMVDGLKQLEAAPHHAASLGAKGKAAVEERFRRSALAAKMLAAVQDLVAGRGGAESPNRRSVAS